MMAAACGWTVAAASAQQPQPQLTPLPYPDVAPPVLPEPARAWWPLVLGIVVVSGLLALLIWLMFRRKVSPLVNAEPPLVRATARLEALNARLDAMTPGETAHEVSVILRDYLQGRYSVPAPCRTTEELYGERAIQGRDGLRERFEPVAAFYDRLEFAPQPATRSDSEKLIASALQTLRDEKRYNPGAVPPPLPLAPPSLPFVPTKL